jgi:hypothetical protein
MPKLVVTGRTGEVRSIDRRKYKNHACEIFEFSGQSSWAPALCGSRP